MKINKEACVDLKNKYHTLCFLENGVDIIDEPVTGRQRISTVVCKQEKKIRIVPNRLCCMVAFIVEDGEAGEEFVSDMGAAYRAMK